MIHGRPMAPCVRCGRRPRSRGTFLCDICLADPKAIEEVRRVQGMAEGYLEQRRVAIERFHWAGGWGRP